MTSIWENTNLVIGSVSGLLSIIAMIVVRSSWQKRAMLAGYVLAAGLIAGIATYQSVQLSRISQISRVADELSAARRMKFTNRAFIQASLSFLEKNRDLYPDMYQRALKLCDNFKCDSPGSEIELVDLAFTMAGVVRGLGTLAREQ